MRTLVTRMQQLHQPPPDDEAPVFLYISRLETARLEEALSGAFARAHESAERLARSAGLRLGPLSSLHAGGGHEPSRPDRMVERQRCLGLLTGCPYQLGENEIVSDDPRAADFTISVNVNYPLE
jgi:uncharacterized protein YggE